MISDASRECMHATSFNEMGSVLRRYLDAYTDRKLKVIDVGSKKIGHDHTYRELMPHTWEYIGVDIEAGENVDVILQDPYRLPMPDNSVNIAISGQCLEHTSKPWVLVKEFWRVLDPGGHCLITAPAKMHLHSYPHDYWRFTPEGLKSLMADAGFRVKETYTIPADGLLDKFYGNPWTVDCWGIGIK
jgi:SAM-dependent methyltransferase